MPYSAYDYDRLEAARTMKIDRTAYFETAAENITPLAALPLSQFEQQREESAAAEQTFMIISENRLPHGNSRQDIQPCLTRRLPI